MHILLIGGTLFLGRALVDAALARGHRLTLFNRGRSNPDLYPAKRYPQLETIIGDRDGGLDVLDGRRWDAVIDTCGYVPRIVRQSAEKLANAVQRYVFISSISVYADSSIPGSDESAVLATIEDESREEITGDTYGPLKAMCEQTVEKALPGRALTVRPGLLVGPHDRSDRFTYWPHRVDLGGEVLAPGRAQRHIQFIDVRDVAGWIIKMVEQGQAGIFNVDGPVGSISMEDVLKTCQRVSGSDVQFTWVSEAFLQNHEVGMWMEMPLWVPEIDPEYDGFFAFDCSKAQAAGLEYRALEDTIRDTLEWCRSLPADYAWRAGLTRERETDLLKKWHDG